MRATTQGVRSFEELGVECHLRCGRLRDLIERLSRDFKCKIVRIFTIEQSSTACVSRMLLNIATVFEKARKALACRYLFDNWPSLMIKYALLKLGFDVKLIAKIRGCTFEMSPETFEQLVGRSSRGLIKSIKCVDGKILVNG